LGNILNFNEAFVAHVAGLTANKADALKTHLTNHVNRPEDQLRWRRVAGDMWDIILPSPITRRSTGAGNR